MKQYTWHKIANSLAELQFSASGLTPVEVDGKKLCLALQHDQLFACAATCPHAGGMMAMGTIDATGNIVCPRHRYKFSLANGHNVSGEGYHLKTYPVEQRPEGIFIGIEKGGLFGWLK